MKMRVLMILIIWLFSLSIYSQQVWFREYMNTGNDVFRLEQRFSNQNHTVIIDYRTVRSKIVVGAGYWRTDKDEYRIYHGYQNKGIRILLEERIQDNINFRLRIKVGKKYGVGKYKLQISEEAFVQKGFDQNRVSLVVSRRIDKLNFEIGYLNLYKDNIIHVLLLNVGLII